MTFLLMLVAITLAYLAGYIRGANSEERGAETLIGICLLLGSAIVGGVLVMLGLGERK